jgi:hypothetical protein
MAQPLDAVLAFHNAFRNDMQLIDRAARDTARGKPGQEKDLERYRFFNEILVWHANGEELAIFPAVESVAPLVAEAYQRDHRGLDAAYEAMHAAVSAKDILETARASAAFKFHLDIHLAKEDAHLYRIVRERITAPEQAKAVSLMSTTVPRERFAEVIAWLFPLIGADDQENMTRIWQMVMPAEMFSQVKMLVQKATGEGWQELVRRIPTLA